MVQEKITVDGMEARLFQIGIRCDYYVTECGDCYSLSKGPKSRTRRLAACMAGHKNPTIRVKVFDGDVVVVRNLPIYRVVFDIFSGEYHDWNRCRISFIDGSPLNYSYANMRIEPMKRHSPILVSALEANAAIYSDRFDDICIYITRRFDSISFDDAKDIVSSAFFYLCRADAPVIANFEAFWIRASFRLAQYFWARQARRESIEDARVFFDEPTHDYCNLSIYGDLGLTPCEKVMVDMMMKGYTRMEVGKMMGCKYDFQIPVKFYDIAAKFRRAYCD